MAADSLVNWGLLSLSAPGWGGVLLQGFLNSIQIAVGGFTLGLALGVGGAFGKLYGGPVLRDLLECYTTIVRAVPELVLILLLYYAGTDLLNQLMTAIGYGPVDISGLAAGIFVIGIVQGAYSTEVLRGAIKAVPFSISSGALSDPIEVASSADTLYYLRVGFDSSESAQGISIWQKTGVGAENIWGSRLGL